MEKQDNPDILDSNGEKEKAASITNGCLGLFVILLVGGCCLWIFSSSDDSETAEETTQHIKLAVPARFNNIALRYHESLHAYYQNYHTTKIITQQRQKLYEEYSIHL